jgi:protein-L-isoaspartate(D-aspartate) O-methyltransferase
MDYALARTKMVDNQIRTTDVTSHSVLSAFLSVPREIFVPEKLRALAYIDNDIEVAPCRYVMEPSPLAKLLQLAQIRPEDKVLEIACGSGYASALLACLSTDVVALESDAGLAETAKANLAAQGFGNVSVVTGDLEKGHAAKGPYDVIFINGAVEIVPEDLFRQLKDGGRLVTVVGFGLASRAKVFLNEGGVVSERPEFNTSVKPLPGFRKVAAFVF